jgi:hypothetical protein
VTIINYSARSSANGPRRISMTKLACTMGSDAWNGASTLTKGSTGTVGGHLRDSPMYICESESRARTKVRPMLKLAGVPMNHCQFIEDLPMQQDEHWIDWLLRFGETTPDAFQDDYGTITASPATAPQLRISPAERDDRDKWLQSKGLLGRPLVLLQPSNKRTVRWNGIRRTDDDDKSWPAGHWASVAHEIRRRLPNAEVLLCGSSREARHLDELMRAASPEPPFKLAVISIGCLKGLLDIAHSMVSVDTGPAHLAAAMGTPLVVLFGNQSPALWAPRQRSGSAVTVMGGAPASRPVADIPVSAVMNAWYALPRR